MLDVMSEGARNSSPKTLKPKVLEDRRVAQTDAGTPYYHRPTPTYTTPDR